MTVPQGGTARIFIRSLPEIYRGSAALEALLSCFEEVLVGPSSGPKDRSLQQRLSASHEAMEPFKAPVDFLHWLASWIGFTLRSEFNEDVKRQLIANAVVLYQCRGTRSGIQKAVEIVTGCGARVFEPEISSLRVGIEAVIGQSTRLGRDVPHFFSVSIEVPGRLEHRREQIEALGRLVVDRTKPAHTFYSLTVAVANPSAGSHREVSISGQRGG
jgi:phage tail-like protein